MALGTNTNGQQIYIENTVNCKMYSTSIVFIVVPLLNTRGILSLLL